MQFTITTKFPLSLKYTALSHGWVNLDPWSWNDIDCALSRKEKIKGKIIRICLKQKNIKRLSVYVSLDNLSLSMKTAVQHLIFRWLSLDWDPSEFLIIAKKQCPPIAEYIMKGGGRFLRGSTFYEDFVKTLCTINASWAFTRKMISRIVTELGNGVFPVPAKIIDTGVERLEKIVKMGYRGKILIESTLNLLEQNMIKKNGECQHNNITYDKLKNMKGIGHYAASHLMFLMHDFSKIPVDSEVAKYCNKKYGMCRNEIQNRFETWEKFAFLGYKLERIIERDNWIG